MIRIAVGWLNLTFASSVERRCRIIRELAGTGVSAIPLLLRQFVRTDAPAVRDAALQALRQMGPESITYLLKRYERSERVAFTTKALSAFLSEIDPAHHGAGLVAKQLESCRARWATDPRRHTELIHDYLGLLEEGGETAQSAAFAIKNLIEDTSLQPTDVVVGFGLPSGTPIHATYDLRCEAVRALGRTAGHSEIEYLGRLAVATGSPLRPAALSSLVALKDSRSTPFLLSSLEGGDSDVVSECIDGIARIGPPASSAQPALARIMDGTVATVSRPKALAYAAANALIAIGSPPPGDALATAMVEALQESQRLSREVGWAFRLEVAKRLSKLNSALLLPHWGVLKALSTSDSDADVRKVLGALVRLP